MHEANCWSLVPPIFVASRRGLKDLASSVRWDPTPAEGKLWFEFLPDLPLRFSRQKPLGNYIADFYCASRLLIIEVDGDSHFTDPGEAYDDRRSTALEAKGVRIIRFTNLEVMEQFEAVCQRIRDTLEI